MVFETLQEVEAAIGQHLGTSPWVDITQDMVNQFAESTKDLQWIHVDVERANRESPFGAPIAHGFLTLSLASYFISHIMTVKSVKMGVNYGLNKVRFISPVKVGSRVRMSAKLLSSEPYRETGRRSITECTFEIEGEDKPACIAEWVGLAFE
ncbi:MAG: MaoC family dehydratase [Bacteroidota bacterium]